MKTTRLYTAALMLLASAFTLTGCDDDPWDYYDYSQGWYDDYDWYDDPFNYGNSTLNQEAAALRGYWTGKVENQSYDAQGQLQSTTAYADFEFDQYDTNSLNGRGRETDYIPKTDSQGNVLYDESGNVVYLSYPMRFSWYIDPRTGDINLKYDDSGYTYTAAWDGGFKLETGSSFYGVMEDRTHNERILFDLTRTTLAKPNIEYTGTAASQSAAGMVFGTRKAVGTDFSSVMKIRKR